MGHLQTFTSSKSYKTNLLFSIIRGELLFCVEFNSSIFMLINFFILIHQTTSFRYTSFKKFLAEDIVMNKLLSFFHLLVVQIQYLCCLVISSQYNKSFHLTSKLDIQIMIMILFPISIFCLE